MSSGGRPGRGGVLPPPPGRLESGCLSRSPSQSRGGTVQVCGFLLPTQASRGTGEGRQEPGFMSTYCVPGTSCVTLFILVTGTASFSRRRQGSARSGPRKGHADLGSSQPGPGGLEAPGGSSSPGSSVSFFLCLSAFCSRRSSTAWAPSGERLSCLSHQTCLCLGSGGSVDPREAGGVPFPTCPQPGPGHWDMYLGDIVVAFWAGHLPGGSFQSHELLAGGGESPVGRA